MTHLSPDGGAVSPPPAMLSRQVLDVQIALRRARLAELEAEMIAACEAAALGAHAREQARLRARALGPGDLASLSRRRHAAGSDLRPAHAPSSPGNRPTRTADDTADRRLIGHGGLSAALPLPRDHARSGSTRGSSTAAGPRRHRRTSRQARLVLLTRHTGRVRAIVMIRSSVRIPSPPFGACRRTERTGGARRRRGHRAADPRGRVPSIPPTSANAAGSPVMRTARSNAWRRQRRSSVIGGMKPDGQAISPSVWIDPPCRAGSRVAARFRRGPVMDLRSFPASRESRCAVSASPPRMRAVWAGRRPPRKGGSSPCSLARASCGVALVPRESAPFSPAAYARPRKPHPRGRTPAQRRRDLPGREKGSRS